MKGGKNDRIFIREVRMKRDRLQCVCEAHLQKQFRKSTLYDHKYLQIWQINLTKA